MTNIQRHAQSHRQATAPDLAALRAMIFHVDEFPAKRHHRKAPELLFPAASRTHAAGGWSICPLYEVIRLSTTSR